MKDGRAVDNHLRAPRPAARVVYEGAHGPIPEGHEVHHTCENGWCVEPAHLVAMSPEEHRLAHRRTHCPAGHQLEGENLYVPPKHPGQRACRTCRKARSAESYRRHARRTR